jgi:hypothetical protein
MCTRNDESSSDSASDDFSEPRDALFGYDRLRNSLFNVNIVKRVSQLSSGWKNERLSRSSSANLLSRKRSVCSRYSAYQTEQDQSDPNIFCSWCMSILLISIYCSDPFRLKFQCR